MFFWFSVPHDRLFLDALDRDLKREKLGQDTTTEARSEPALSFEYNPQLSLYEQFASSANEGARAAGPSGPVEPRKGKLGRNDTIDPTPGSAGNPAGVYALFEGSPAYKARRKGTTKNNKSLRSVSVGKERSASPAPPMSAPPRYEQDAYAHPPPVPVPMTAYPRAREPLYSPYPTPMQPSPNWAAPQLELKAFTCPLLSCGRVFRRHDLLKRHIASHEVDEVHPCGRCRKKFGRAEQLASHMRLHEQRDELATDGQTQLALNSMREPGEIVEEEPSDPMRAWQWLMRPDASRACRSRVPDAALVDLRRRQPSAGASRRRSFAILVASDAFRPSRRARSDPSRSVGRAGCQPFDATRADRPTSFGHANCRRLAHDVHPPRPVVRPPFDRLRLCSRRSQGEVCAR